MQRTGLGRRGVKARAASLLTEGDVITREKKIKETLGNEIYIKLQLEKKGKLL